jgi:hypothetical protein
MHEGLWLLVGTVAPVVALGNTITITRGFELLNGIKVVRKVKPWMWPSTLQVVRCMAAFAWISLLLCIQALFCAVISLASDSDVHSSGWPFIFSPMAQGVLSATSLVLLIPPLWAEAWVRGLNFFAQEVEEAKAQMAEEDDRTYQNVDYEALQAIKDRTYVQRPPAGTGRA